jgi:hypothetical protein
MALPLPKGLVRTKEDLLDDAAQLKEAGLKQVAAILTDLSSSALPMDDLSFCCYSADVPANRVSWLRAQRQRQAQREQRLKPMGKPGRPKANKPI